MADEKVSIVLKVEAHDRQLNMLMAKMRRLEQMERRLSSGRRVEEMARSQTRSITNMARSWKRSFDFIDKSVAMTGKFLSGFLAKSIKGVIVEMLALSATLVAVHASFVAGQLIMKAYRGVMQLVAGGAAAATMAVAAFSSAIREQQAAMFAYRGKGAKEYGTAMNQTRYAMRALQTDAELSTLGVEALNKAFGNMSKSMNSRQIVQSTDAIKALMDFGSAGQDPAKAVEQVGVVIAALADKKKNISQVITEAKKLGPEMESALKKANVKTKKQFETLLLSGELAKKGGVSGQFDVMNQTLIGQLKGYVTQLRGVFADFGDQFLEPLKIAFGDIFEIIKRDLARIMTTIQSTIGYQGYIDGFVGMIDKASNWMVKMIREYLPQAMGMFGRMGDWFDKFRRGWNMVLERLRPLIEGARVLYKAWDPIWDAIKRAATNLTLFRDLLVENKDSMAEFGTIVGRFIDVVSRYFQGLKRMFAEMGPFISDVLKGLTGVLSMFTKIITSGAGSGLFGALAPLMGGSILGKRMQSVRGRLLPGVGAFNPQTMNVTAGQVYVQGEAGPTQISAPAAGSGGRMSSGATGAASFTDVLGGTSVDDKMQKSAYAKFGQPGYLPIGEMFKDPRQTMFASIRAGSRKAVQHSTIEGRMRARAERRYEAGRGISFAMTDIFAGSGTMTGFSAMSRMPRYQLARYAASLGIPVNGSMTRSQLISAIQATPPPGGAPLPGLYMRGRMPYEHPSMTRGRVTIGEGISNTMARAGSRIGAGIDRIQYGARRAIGGVRGFAGYANSGAFDYETGTYYDIEGSVDPTTGKGTGMAALRARRDSIKQQRGRFGQFRAELQFMRDRNRLFRQYSKFGMAYNQKFAQSGKAKMGVGVGLSMLSQSGFIPEESRGAVAIGGMLGQMDPRLGLGVAGLGVAATSRKTGTAMIGGGIGGAAMGAQFGPYGMIAGAIIGSVFGGIMSAINRAKDTAKAARKAAAETIGSIYMTLARSAAGQFEQNRTMLAAGIKLGPNTQGAFQNIFKDAIRNQRALANTVNGLMVQSQMAKNNTAFTDFEGKIKALYAGGRVPTSSEANALTQEINKALPGVQINMPRVAGGDLMALDQLQRTRATRSEVAGLSQLDAAEATIDYIFKNQGRLGIEMSADQLKSALASPLNYINSLRGNNPAGKPDFATMVDYADVVEKRLTALQTATGKTVPELEVLAKELGINLYDATIKYDTLLGKLTKNVLKSSEQLNFALSDVFLAGKNPFTKKREKKEAITALDKEMSVLGDQLAKTKDKGRRQGLIDKHMENYFNLALAAAGGDAMQAYMATYEAFGQGPTGGAFAKGQIFEGFGADFAASGTMKESLANIKEGSAKTYGTQLQAILAGAGFQVEGGQLKNAIMGLEGTSLERFAKEVKGFGTGTSVLDNLAGKDAAQIQEVLASLGIFATPTIAGEGLDKIANLNKEQLTELGLIEGHLFKLVNSFFTGPDDGAPGWWTRGLQWDDTNKRLVPPDQISGDTSSPRGSSIGDTATSKLSQTMARHSSISSQLAGKRTITSGIRNYALGSPSSDHTTGAAIDLVGQNLGQYAALTRASGGFAEFHGSAASRHLHVVPGAGIGDSSTPNSPGSKANQALAVAMASSGAGIKSNAGSSTSGGNTYYYNFEINGGNQSPEQIARVVMAKIKAQNSAVRERG